MPDTVHVTFFENAAAQSIKVADLTLDELKTRILNTSANNKAKLPWLKLAIFGNKRTVKKSLRFDANVISITGVELDYDGPDGDETWIGFDQAVELVRAIGITALVYTSPSHTAATPKWRVLAPSSCPLPPAQRAKLVARINGHMGCPIKKRESFTLSQGFYFGRSRENENANHLAIVLDGDYVDLRSDLNQFEDAGKSKPDRSDPDNAFSNLADENSKTYCEGIHGFSKILSEIGDGPDLKGFNDVLTRAIASYVALYNGHPFDVVKLKTMLRKAIDDAPKKSSRPASDIVRYRGDYYLDDAIDTAQRKFVRERNKTIDDFIAYLPMHNYIYIPTGQHWPLASVNSCLPPVPMVDVKGRPIMKSGKHKNVQKTQKAAEWLDQYHCVEQATWVPGEPPIIRDKVMPDGGGNGWIEHPGSKVFNLYHPPTISGGNPNSALPWINHIHKIYPDDADHIINFMAHRVQHPSDKINHALVLGGNPGIGKDTLLEPVKKAVGPWNFQEISPSQIMAPFNQFLQAVVLRISEARDQGEVGQYKFHEHMKVICAAPPDVLRVNAKHIVEYYIPNCCGVIMTTNHKTGALWLPANDRRTYIAWSNLTQDDFTLDYWKKLWEWLGKGEGCSHVAAYLGALDISSFDSKAPPRKTDAFHAVVDAGVPDKVSEIADALDFMGRPDAVTVSQLEIAGDPDLQEWLIDIKNLRQIHYRMEANGYVPIRNPNNSSGLWVILGRRKKVYVRDNLTTTAALHAAQKLMDEWNRDKKPPENSVGKSTVHPFRRF